MRGPLETDYLVVGTGAAGMAFTAALLSHSDATVTLEPSDPAAASVGQAIRVRVEVPYGSNRLLGLSRLMPLPSTLAGSGSMVKEPDA